jgi:amidohydrolase
MNLQLRERIDALYPSLVEVRRDLHRHPELGYEEIRTSRRIHEWLSRLGLEVRQGVARTGVVARLRGARPGRTVALRADMDALPIQDVKTCDYASTVPGKMHACGHDAHVAMALGSATILAELRDTLEGDVVFLFQPAEEGPGGAEAMIADGALDGVDFILGQHMLPLYPAGQLALSEGAALAAVDEFIIRIRGRGGHGGYPHLTVDTIPIAAQLVGALQTVVSRTVDPHQPAVLSIGMIQGGYNFNVIADVTMLKGTVRTFDPALRLEIRKRIETLVDGIVRTFGAQHELDYIHHYAPTINPPEGVSMMKQVAGEVLGAENVHVIPPSMGGEDFGYFLRRVPGCFYWLGCKHPEARQEYNIHHPGFDIDERALAYGVQLYVEGVLRAHRG